MVSKGQLSDSVRKHNFGDRKGFLHSKAYHKHFEGYTEVRVPKPNGKGIRIERIYTGDYYRQDLTKYQRIVLRLLYTILFMCAVYLYVTSATLPLAINSTWYVTLPEAASIPLLFWIAVAFLLYLLAAQDMTISDYRSSSQSLLKATIGAAICLGACALTTLFFLMLNPSDESLQVALCAVKYAISSLLVLAINRIERRIPYLKVLNSTPHPENGIEIG